MTRRDCRQVRAGALLKNHDYYNDPCPVCQALFLEKVREILHFSRNSAAGSRERHLTACTSCPIPGSFGLRLGMTLQRAQFIFLVILSVSEESLNARLLHRSEILRLRLRMTPVCMRLSFLVILSLWRRISERKPEFPAARYACGARYTPDGARYTCCRK